MERPAEMIRSHPAAMRGLLLRPAQCWERRRQPVRQLLLRRLLRPRKHEADHDDAADMATKMMPGHHKPGKAMLVALPRRQALLAVGQGLRRSMQTGHHRPRHGALVAVCPLDRLGPLGRRPLALRLGRHQRTDRHGMHGGMVTRHLGRMDRRPMGILMGMGIHLAALRRAGQKATASDGINRSSATRPVGQLLLSSGSHHKPTIWMC